MRRRGLRKKSPATRAGYWALGCACAVVPLAMLLSAFTARSMAAEPLGNLTGKLLVATPEMGDPRFSETVIYVVKHNVEGAFGIVINRPVAKGPIRDLLQGFGVENKNVKGEVVIHYGGPVGQNQGFVLHSDEVLLEDSTKVKDGIAMTSDSKLIEAIGLGKGPRQYLIMLGYAGWAPGQLEAEIDANAWFVVTGDKALIFGDDAEKKWRRAVDKRQIPL
jgi:putative transcriptional regulator